MSFKPLSVEHTLDKPVIIHHLNILSLGGTEKMVETNMSFFIQDDTFIHYLAYKSNGDLAREEFFKQILGNRMLPYGSEKEFINIIGQKKKVIQLDIIKMEKRLPKKRQLSWVWVAESTNQLAFTETQNTLKSNNT